MAADLMIEDPGFKKSKTLFNHFKNRFKKNVEAVFKTKTFDA